MVPYYDDGQVTILHADCRDVLPQIEAGSVNLVLTDPPYGIGYDTNTLSRKRGNRSNAYDHVPVYGDDAPFDPSPLLRFKRLVLFGANCYAHMLPPSAGWIVWDKRPGFRENDNGDCELAWTNVTGAVRRFAHRWDGVIRDSENGDHVLHPTQKPVALMAWIITKWTNPGDLVLDPYMGSGPVAKACHMTGRRYIGIEIHEPYVEIAVKRLAQAVLPLGDIA